ncbi:DUF6163 family protein [Beijerinckia indica]|uniref:DUF6163 family protein n=1 Tax=Beijerinckia indica TaxID=533 RepID=UPI00030CF080|nr:DUF6163 family protein [Beijerinckia indica]
MRLATRPIESDAAISLTEKQGSEARSTPWSMLLVVFMRLLAMIWMAQGLAQWATVLVPSAPAFDHESWIFGAGVIFFAVFDLMAAVGLWLATPWGGVLWLLAALAQICMALLVRPFFSLLWVGANLFLICLYFILTWFAGQAESAD